MTTVEIRAWGRFERTHHGTRATLSVLFAVGLDVEEKLAEETLIAVAGRFADDLAPLAKAAFCEPPVVGPLRVEPSARRRRRSKSVTLSAVDPGGCAYLDKLSQIAVADPDEVVAGLRALLGKGD